MTLKIKKFPYKDKTIKLRLSSNSLENDFYIYVVLLNDVDNEFSNVGHLVLKYESKRQSWWIVEIELNSKERGHNFGAAMLLQGIKAIKQLTEDYPESIKSLNIHGMIGGIFLTDINDSEEITKSNGYWKIKSFYETLGFNFTDDIHFKKELSKDILNEWPNTISANIEIKELKLELAIKNRVLKSYENELNYLESKWLGRYLLKNNKGS